jgi:hypothetical protein
MSHDINALGQPVGVAVLNWTPPIHLPSAVAGSGRIAVSLPPGLPSLQGDSLQ